MVISRRALLLAGVALPVMPRIARSQCVTDTPAVDACLGGVRITAAPPSLDLSFLAPGALPAGLTFTRASTATYFDATGTLQSAATNAPRWDYSPSALTLNGLLIEEARTNSIRNSTAAGAVPGSPGTMPTNWVLGVGTTALSSQVVASGTEDGIAYVDLRIFGTVGATGPYHVLPESTTAIVAANGQPWSYSQYWRLIAGTLTGIASTQLLLREGTAAGGSVRDNFGALTPLTVAALKTQRVIAAATLSGGGTVGTVHGRVVINVTSGAAVDVTIRLGAPQIEQGAYPTSFIPTSSATVARSAEVCSMPTGAWFNAAASSLAADFMVAQAPNPSATLARQPAALSDGAGANRLRLIGQVGGTSNAILASSVAGVGTSSAALGAISANAVAKMAGSWNGAIGIGSLNGGAAVSYAVGMPTLNLLTIGVDPGAINYLNGWVWRVRYWNTALSAAQLQSVTT